MQWQYSGVGLKALADSLRARPDFDRVRALLRPETAAALERPALQKWHDGAVVFDLTLAMDQVMGGDAIEEVHYDHVRRSIGPLLAPFVKVALALAGKDPRTIYKRMDDMMVSVVRGVKCSWVEQSPTSGLLTVLYAHDEVKPPSLRAWAGVIRYTFDLCEVKGQVSARFKDFDGHRLEFDVSWTAGP